MRLAVDMAFGIEVDQDLGRRKALLQLLLDPVQPVVRLLHASSRPAPRRGTGRTRACRWCGCAGRGGRRARDIRRRRRGRPCALLLRPFPVHQLVDRLAATRAKRRNSSHAAMARPNDGSAPASRAYWSSTKRGDHRRVEQQVRLVMELVGVDRDRAGAGGSRGAGRRAARGSRRWRTSDTPMPSSASAVCAAAASAGRPRASRCRAPRPRSARPGTAPPAPRPCRGRSDGRGRPASAAIRTPSEGRRGWRRGRARCRRASRASRSSRSARPPSLWRRAGTAPSRRWRAPRARSGRALVAVRTTATMPRAHG